MERINIFIRTTKKDGDIAVRFRLIDGRDVQLYYTSEIIASLEDLSKFNTDGTVRSKVTNYNKDLHEDLSETIAAIKKVYHRLKNNKRIDAKISDEDFKVAVRRELHPERIDRTADSTLISKYRNFVQFQYNGGVFGGSRLIKYTILGDKLERFLTIRGLRDLTPAEFTDETLTDFRQFIFDEYLYVDSWRGLYTRMKERDIPSARLSANTVATNLKLLSAFFTDLESKQEITVSPFRHLGKTVRKIYLHEDYDAPYYLTADEFAKILGTEVPATLKATKDAFVVQCALGCRIGDYQSLTMDNVSVSPEGIPYVHYLPHKTSAAQDGNTEVETPLVRFAFDIIKQNQFQFPVLKYATGQTGYNAKIKTLMEVCGIDKKVAVSEREGRTKVNNYVALSDLASSKLCRKTHVDMLTKVQVNMYASGLHKQGSKAVEHYSALELKDRFILLCAAFNQPQYKVNEDLEIC